MLCFLDWSPPSSSLQALKEGYTPGGEKKGKEGKESLHLGRVWQERARGREREQAREHVEESLRKRERKTESKQGR